MAINLGREEHRAYRLAAPDNTLVQYIPRAKKLISPQVFGAKHHPGFEPVIAAQGSLQGGLPIITVDFNKESQPTKVNSKDRHVVWGT